MYSGMRARPRARFLVLAAASSAVCLGLTVSPAVADEAAQIGIGAPAAIDLERGARTTVDVTLDIKPEKPGDTEAKDVWFDATTRTGMPFAPLVSVATPPGCETYPDGQGFTCRWDLLPVGTKQLALTVDAAAPDGLYGGEGSLRYSAKQGHGTIINATTTVSLHAPSALAVTLPGRSVQAKPGTTFDVEMGTQNVAGTPFDKVSLVVNSEYGLESAERHSNCRYATYGGTRTGNLAVCDFDTVIQPGESYALDGSYTMAATEDIPGFGGQFGYSFMSADDARKIIEGDPKPATVVSGTGPRLGLVKSQATAPDRWARSAYFSVEAIGQTSRMTARPATVGAPVGQEVDLRAVVRNEGAATLNTWSGSEGLHVGVVFLPKGVTVVKAPEGCSADDGYSQPAGIPISKPAGGSNYACFIDPHQPWKAGTDREFVFRVKMTEPMTAAKGHNVSYDGNDGYSVAEIVFDTSVTPTPGPTDGSGTGSPDGSQTGVTPGGNGNGNGPGPVEPGEPSATPSPAPTGGSGTGVTPANSASELARTGGSSAVPLITSVAGGLLLVAAGAFAVARRRKAAGRIAV